MHWLMPRMVCLASLFFVNDLGLAMPGDGVIFHDLPAFNARTNARWGEVLTDVMQHEVPGENNNYDDKVTLSHETSHGIHSYIRNRLNDTGKRANGFYVMENRAVLVEEPPIRKSKIAAFVPVPLRGMRYSTYVTGQTSWDDTPLYIWDEWNGYVNGAAVGVNLVESGLWNAGWRDALMGPLEFVVYALATGMAVKQHASAYFDSNTQFKEFLAYNIERSMDLFFKGRVMSDFAWATQDAYYEKFKSSPEAAGMRAFVKGLYGEEWVKAVLGF